MLSTGVHEATENTLPPPLIQVMPRQRWVDLGLVFLIGFVPLVTGAVYRLFVPIEPTQYSTNYGFSTGLVHEVGVLVLWFTLFRRQNRSLNDIGLNFHWLDLPKGMGLFVLSSLASILVSYATQYVHFFWTGSYLQFRDPQTIFAGASTTLFVLYIIAAPIFEETLVRGYLMTELIGLSCPVWLAALASIALQTSYHLYYGVAGALSVGGGFTVCAIYFAKSRRLMPVLLSHFLWDVAATYLTWHRS